MTVSVLYCGDEVASEFTTLIQWWKFVFLGVKWFKSCFVSLKVVWLFFHQELNVRQLTLSTDKDKYGIRLRAEPDHMVLGKRLKGAFKSVTASIKELKSEELENFQKTGMYHIHTWITQNHHSVIIYSLRVVPHLHDFHSSARHQRRIIGNSDEGKWWLVLSRLKKATNPP